MVQEEKTMQDMIKLKNVTKKFSDITIVNIKELTLRKGEIYGFLGPNGAGKSTTMKMILSLIAPTSGQISVMDQSTNTSLSYLNHIGSMIEEPSYYPNLTGYENLLVFQRILGFDESNIVKTLKLVGLWNRANDKKLVKSYSLGMKQRLALAFALVKKPQILLLDEPTNGLDPSGIHEIRELIIRLAKEHGISILISSHILSEIEQIADRVGIISHGKLVYEGKISQIKANEWIEIEGDFDASIVKRIISEHPEISLMQSDNRLLKIAYLQDQTLALLIEELVLHGNKLYRVERKKESLEEIFLNLTREA
jgi:ABC-2 type transport system ATP-binding protein